ncbi:MAG: type II toxin-antitoxin system RelE/ParE family toxin [Edaphobacter sp.]
MAEVRFSRRAEFDLQAIDDYTIQTWSEDQADLYLGRLRGFCAKLAETPDIGRLWNPQREGLRRIEQGSHVVFYRKTRDGVLITRILHRSMLPDNHILDPK